MQWMDLLSFGRRPSWRHSVSTTDRWHLLAQALQTGRGEVSLWRRSEADGLLVPVRAWPVASGVEALAFHRSLREGMASLEEDAPLPEVLAALPRGPRPGRRAPLPRRQGAQQAQSA